MNDSVTFLIRFASCALNLSTKPESFVIVKDNLVINAPVASKEVDAAVRLCLR